MRFLADESCDFCVVRALRQSGHDVDAVAETASQSPDPDVLTWARVEGRILITEDKDFGHLVFATGQDAAGVILIRFPAAERGGLAEAITTLLDRLGDGLRGSFVVLEPGRMRITRLPSE
jgi:predicted nuclease of predicted toxin-antitoxin system